MKKKTIIIFILIVIAVLGIVTKLVLDLNKETKIRNEIKEISKVFDIANIDDDQVNEILSRRIVKKGHYADVEDSIKTYYTNLYSDLKNLTFLLDDDNFSSYLTEKNLNDDKPTFIKSKDNLQNSKAQIEEYYTKLTNELTDKTTKLSYAAKKNLSTYYRDFYLELTTLAIADDFQSEIETAYKQTNAKIDVYNEALDFLIANKGHWEVKNEVIIFDETTLYEEYLVITDKLTNQTESQEEKEVSEN